MKYKDESKAKKNLIRLLSVTTVVFFLLPFFVAAEEKKDASEELPPPKQEQTKEGEDTASEDLSESIEKKEKELHEIEEKIDYYNKAIETKQQEQLTLKSQVEVLDANIEKTKANIEAKSKEIELLRLEIGDLKGKIQEKEEEINLQKGRLQKTLQKLYIHGQKSPLEITVTNDSFSDFYSQITYLQSIDKEMQQTVDTIQALRDTLQAKKLRVEDKKKEIEGTKKSLEIENQDLESQKGGREELLQKTTEDEGKFQAIVEQIRNEHQTVESEIRTLEAKLRERLDDLEKKREKEEGESGEEFDESDFGGPLALTWPVESREITCGFHCEGYPFARFFEHSGIDIKSPQGTLVKAAASGYVAIAKDGGATGYTYIMLVHGDGYATVYGHLSQIDGKVYEKLEAGRLVRKGEIIGLSGGIPGTPGAGGFSTGAHLHFELRENGIPIDPLPFLP